MLILKKIVLFVLIALISVGAFSIEVKGISAAAAVVINAQTGEILYENNADARLPMASTTKIMTALLLCELGGDLSREIVTTKEMVTVEGSSMGLMVGDKVSLEALLYGMMLASGNDAANTTAIVIGGSVQKFCDLMNERAAEIGLSNTNFETPSGLDSDEHYTTAYELALIAREALKNKAFAKAASSKSKTLYYGNPPYRRTLKNHNKLLSYYDDIIGVKTGFTKKSGRCLVSAGSRDGKKVIAVTLNDRNDWADHRALIDLGYSKLNAVKYSPKSAKVTIAAAFCEEALRYEIPSIEVFSQKSSVTHKTFAPRFFYSDACVGEEIGKIQYLCDDSVIKEIPLKVTREIKNKRRNNLYIILEVFKTMISKI